MLSPSNLTSIENIDQLRKYKASEDDQALFKEHSDKLHALLQVQKEALEQLIVLQESWNATVENETIVGEDIIKNFRAKLDSINATGCSGESEESLVLRSKVEEAAGGMKAAQDAFNQYREANSNRQQVFANFADTPSVDE